MKIITGREYITARGQAGWKSGNYNNILEVESKGKQKHRIRQIGEPGGMKALSVEVTNLRMDQR